MVIATPALTAPWGIDALLTLTNSARIADERGCEAINQAHLLMALVAPRDRTARRLLEQLSVQPDAIVETVASSKLAPEPPEEPGRFDFAARGVLGSAMAEAKSLGSDRIDDEHLLLGLLCGVRGPALTALEQAGVTIARARSAAREWPRNPEQTSRRLRESGLTADEVRSEAARLMGDAAAKRKLIVVEDVPSRGAERMRRAIQRPPLNPWSFSRDSARIGDLVAATRPSPLFLGLLGVLGCLAGLLVWDPVPRYERLFIVLFVIAGWIVSLCVHEYGHAAAAFLGGDRETRLRGYLTLDVRRYANPILTFAMPLAGPLMGGLPLPGGAVLINRHALRSRRWDLAVSAAGPLGTLICLLLAATPFIIGGPWVFLDSHYPLWIALAGLVAVLSSSLVLNLLPVPPLDGFQIVSHWLSQEARARAFALGWIPLILVFALLRQDSAFSYAFWDIVRHIETALRMPYGLGDYALSVVTSR